MDLEFEKNLIVSTGHITESEMNKLGSGETSLACYENEYFTLVYVGEIHVGNPPGDDMTPELKKLINLARKNGCQYLKLNRDGPVLEGLKTYDW